MKLCNSCQLEFDDKYLFCSKCGGKLQDKNDKVFCPYCGNKIETDGEYCPFCGELLIDAEPVVVNSSRKAIEKNKPLKTIVQPNFETSQEQNIAQGNATPQIKPKTSINGNNNKPEIQEESTSKSVLKLILYVIGAFVLFLIIKVIGQGVATAAIRNGYGVHFVVLCLILIPIGMYFRNKY